MSGILNIAISGLNDAVARIANAASNIVNASSTAPVPSSGAAYGGFVPQDVVTLSQSAGGQNFGVTDTAVPRNPAYVVTPDASSPNANADGLVAAPNVDLNAELIASKVAQVTYGANADVVKVAQQMQDALLNIKT
ncbi:MAG TPA: flagellar basal body rod C-terminal domain-containing protein [Alphaproteobacteria bacterium]|nr:flagellar basal body rod C-terminal domain-containing protein [Alphaproteobacteria bacterium]